MKIFEFPEMTVQRLEPENMLTSSDCFEVFACKNCYCEAVICNPYACGDALDCPTLSDYD